MHDTSDSAVNLVTVDGIRIEAKNGWALVRASNTQPALTIRFEADSKQSLNKLINFVQDEINKVTDKICIS